MLDTKLYKLHDLERQYQLIDRKIAEWKKEKMILLDKIVDLEKMINSGGKNV